MNMTVDEVSTFNVKQLEREPRAFVSIHWCSSQMSAEPAQAASTWSQTFAALQTLPRKQHTTEMRSTGHRISPAHYPLVRVCERETPTESTEEAPEEEAKLQLQWPHSRGISVISETQKN